MKIPSWADDQLSTDLPVLRSHGEGQHLEYKEIFPENTRDLAKEIAAFATSNQGTILIGVSNSGDLVGLEGAEKQDERDNLLKRLEGICRGTVKPAITPIAKFAIENEKIVLVVIVPFGRQPIYYSNNIPYVRHLTESRPAEPHEVLELITEYLSSRGKGNDNNKSNARSQFYSDLARVVGEALIYAEQAENRNINPWLDQWRAEFGYAASQLRELSVQNIAIEENIDKNLKEAADSLDAVASLKLRLGCGQDLQRLTRQAMEKLIAIKERELDSIKLSDESLNLIRDSIIVTGRKLHDLVDRSHGLVESGKIEELQAKVSNFGHELLRFAQYDIDNIGKGVKSELTSIGRALHLIETVRLYMDGGISMRAIVDKISEASAQLDQVIDKLKSA